MKKIFATTIVLLLLAPFLVFGQNRCDNYCRAGVFYYNGLYVSRTGICSYQSQACEYGCAGDLKSCQASIDAGAQAVGSAILRDAVTEAPESVSQSQLSKDPFREQVAAPRGQTNGGIVPAANEQPRGNVVGNDASAREAAGNEPTEVSQDIRQEMTAPMPAPDGRNLSGQENDMRQSGAGSGTESERKINDGTAGAKIPGATKNDPRAEEKTDYGKFIIRFARPGETVEKTIVGEERGNSVLVLEKTKPVKLLWFFSVRQKTKVYVDLDSEEMIREEKPWWSFLVTGNKEEQPAKCGDKVCDDGENLDNCLDDCAGVCGDGICSYPDSFSNCPQDCGYCGDGVCGHSEMGKCPQDCLPACGNGKCEATEKIEGCVVDCGYCGDGFCGTMENHLNCPEDCQNECGDGICSLLSLGDRFGCIDDCPLVCGDGVCGGGENYAGCPQDCGYCGDGVCGEKEKKSGKCAVDCQPLCGNGKCEGGENYQKCPFDCGYCGDGVCGSKESQPSGACVADCKETCGDGICEAGETAANCIIDCGYCGDGVCGEKENLTCVDCSKGTAYVVDCGNKICDAGESADVCPGDCLNTCGDGKCSNKESIKSCPQDCKKSFCGDGKCEARDIEIMCALDCKSACGDGLCNGVETEDICEEDCKGIKKKEVIYGGSPAVACADGSCFGLESCGNGKCENWEGIEKCPLDCGWCGDNVCQSVENPENCSLDCVPSCGNGACEESETAENCAVDCKEKKTVFPLKCGNKIQQDGALCIDCEWDCGYCGDGICAIIEKKKCKIDCYSACGNDICEYDESVQDCPFDCAGD